MNEERFRKLQQRADELQREADRAAGARDELLARLKSEYGIDSLEQGYALLKRLKKEYTAAERAYQAEADAFEEKYGDRL